MPSLTEHSLKRSLTHTSIKLLPQNRINKPSNLCNVKKYFQKYPDLAKSSPTSVSNHHFIIQGTSSIPETIWTSYESIRLPPVWPTYSLYQRLIKCSPNLYNEQCRSVSCRLKDQCFLESKDN